MEYNPTITNIPESKLVILNLTCNIPVIPPAIAPATKAAKELKTGLYPFTRKAAATAAPKGKVPSTERSGKSNILYVIYTPKQTMENINPCSNTANKISIIFSSFDFFSFIFYILWYFYI